MRESIFLAPGALAKGPVVVLSGGVGGRKVPLTLVDLFKDSFGDESKTFAGLLFERGEGAGRDVLGIHQTSNE